MSELKRSVLYVPGDNKKALNKAGSLAVDAVIFDLEDAVAPDKKDYALDNILMALDKDYGYCKKIIRVNSLDTEWSKRELMLLSESKIDGLCLPKVCGGKEVITLDKEMQALNYASSIKIWGMIETPLGVLNSYAIAKSSERLTTLVMGVNDLAKEMRIPQTKKREGFLYALSQVVLSARSAGKDVIDGVCIDFKDDAALLTACEQGKILGFDGKTLIHPSQIVTTNNVFSPSLKEVAQASEVITAWDKSIKEGASVAVLNNRLIEELHYQEALRVEQLSKKIQLIQKEATNE